MHQIPVRLKIVLKDLIASLELNLHKVLLALLVIFVLKSLNCQHRQSQVTLQVDLEM